MKPVGLLFAIAAVSLFAAEPEEILGDYKIKFYESGVEYHFYDGVEYLGKDREEKLDIYSPVSTITKKRPAVLFIHGGAWRAGNRKMRNPADWARFFVEKGYVAVSIDYKLSEFEGRGPNNRLVKGAWRQNIYDCKSALRFMKSGIVNIDSERIAVMGSSAGGHLAMLLGYSASSKELNKGGLYKDKGNDVSCIINFYGVPDVRKQGGSMFIEAPRDERPEEWALASPVEHLAGSEPPILIIHGTKDRVVDIEHSRELAELLKEKELPFEHKFIEGAGHGFSVRANGINLMPAVGDFLKSNF
ncbi:acetyl esterase [Sedimentisphaera cyanobacteriorum]|uniref:Acetyl esterase n=1 Tax=Sedimentisphaera cyanobacteriorum TaxID=1940790 RepID=A0A1Q2HRL6_9BACT|nr:alpha/beta hydrolase [Sedimentisphaera cyanobacteriorum]AQQ10108.1 acetyl esterase [Sedimentisphaera cyanobacteriorum]